MWEFVNRRRLAFRGVHRAVASVFRGGRSGDGLVPVRHPRAEWHGGRGPPHSARVVPSCALLLLAAGFAEAQQGIVVQNFKFAPGAYYPPPHEKQLKSLLTGAKAQPQPGGSYLITDGKFETFHETGEREMLAETPQCVYEEAGDHSLHSPGPLRLQAADGKFTITGEVFRWK